jgi:16S rRNA (guanine966-N2)-methyltransferase
MRIIAGQRRGHKIDGPRTSANTRPTSDMVRESVFNILGELVVDRTVYDVFAGTGALGLEALSRGARHAFFVERDRECVGLIIRNVAHLRYEDRASVKLTDAYRWARSFQPADERPVVVLIDPPSQDYERRQKVLNQMIVQLVEKMPAESVVVLESGRAPDRQILADFEQWDIRRYGSTYIAIKLIAGTLAGPGSSSVELSDSSRTDQVGGELETHLDD